MANNCEGARCNNEVQSADLVRASLINFIPY